MSKKMTSNPSQKRKRKKTNRDWAEVFAVLKRQAEAHPSPSLNTLTAGGSTPWQILVATILSLRTRDDVTLASSRRLFSLAPTAAALRDLDLETIETAIFPAGFYHTKAKQILEIARGLETKGDKLPASREGLLAFPELERF